MLYRDGVGENRNVFKSCIALLKFFIIFFCLVVLFSCAPATKIPEIQDKLVAREAEKQRELAFREYLKQQKRLNNVAFTIFMANANLCNKKIAYRFGFSAINKDYASKLKSLTNLAIKVLQLDEYPTVIYVAQNSPAALAGLKEGDIILSINGYDITPDKKGLKFLGKLIKKKEKEPIKLHIRRGEEELDIQMEPVKVCDYDVELVYSDEVNAFANGKEIKVTIGLLRFLQTDEELALILGHELAHNTLGHITKQKTNTIIGATIGAILSGLTGVNVTDAFAQAGKLVFSQEFEMEADYVGCYYAARAGYDVSEAANIWRRMAITHPEIIGMEKGTHPSSAKRFVLIEKTIQEIQDKIKKGLPLIPEFKKSRENDIYSQ